MAHNVIVYSTPTCPWCRRIKEFLDEKGVKYTDVDVSASHEAAQEMVSKSGQTGVPQVDIDGEIIIGFDTDAIEMELAKPS